MTLANGSAANVDDVSPFGDGTDGAFSESSGTTNLTQGTIYRYTTFLLDTSATLSASSTSDKPIIILVQGACTINGTIDLAGKGSTTSYNGGPADAGNSPMGTIGETGSGDTPNGTGGVAGLKSWNFRNNQVGFIMNGTKGGSGDLSVANPRDGGGGGASSATNGSNGSAGGSGSGVPSGSTAAGDGGCTLLMIIGGNLTLGASSSIDVSGDDGVNTSNGNSGGGAGGGAGDILILYNKTKTDNGLTTDVTGGSGAAGAGTGGAGGNGAAGTVKTVAYNTIFGFGGSYPTT